MHISPDAIVFWQHGFVKLNATIVFTWGLMVVLTVGAKLITRNISTALERSRWQNLLEILVLAIEKQIQEIGLTQARHYLGFVATLFVFIASSALATILPGYEPPTGSLSTTFALALCVFAAVPTFGIASRGFRGYLKSYMEPTPLMFPFHVIGELSRTLALSVRLFGNMMSGTVILAILLSIAPLVLPIFMTLLGLLTGMVQAYIFSVLATVYIAAAARVQKPALQTAAAPSSS